MKRSTLNVLSLCMLTLSLSGCSSLGFSLWPTQFPLLNQTKDFAAKSPLPAGLPHELSKQVLDAYYLEPGDRILIEPTDLDSEFRSIGDQEVQVDGSIDLGEFGRVRVAGMTVELVESTIENRIAQFSEEAESINVQLVETNAAQFYVLGQVGSPGAYPLDGNETVLDAIIQAGGLTSRASPCDIILVRPTDPCACRVVLPICYRQITQLGDVSTNYQLQPGDRVVIGTRTLREELAIWKQTRGCERCSRSRGVECEPARVNYASRFAQWMSPFPLPQSKPDPEVDDEGGFDEDPAQGTDERTQTSDRPLDLPPVVPSSSMDEGARTAVPGNAGGQLPSLRTPPAESDSDIFLPPEPGNGSNGR